ncbi:MAG: hypothetical protein VX265_10885 [Myxococcota bacterium]|nr:hypothetical protein [Myxococcota bacterium]
MSGTLALCLGDPLATPPAGDPAGFRLLHARSDSWAWSVHLSGANPCGLDGQIELDAHGHRVRTHGLRAATLPWAEGGREAVVPVARRMARDAAEDRWPEADEAERARIIAALAKDPEAAPLVRRLEAGP